METAQRVKARRDFIGLAKTRAGCAICGFDEHPAALDFNHFKGEKVADLTKMSTYSWERIFEEIKKCVVLCSNHHRIWTATRQKNGE